MPLDMKIEVDIKAAVVLSCLVKVDSIDGTSVLVPSVIRTVADVDSISIVADG